jgi:RHS repeat-associated protein
MSTSSRLALLGFTAIATLSTRAARADVDERGGFVDRIDIPVPEFHGIEPRIALVYQSQGGAGIAGSGWQLQGASAIRRTGKFGGAPSFTSEDRFVLDGVELLPCSETPASPSCMTGGTHATAIDDFRRITLDSSGFWTVWDRDGTVRTYELFLRASAGIDRWLMTSVIDTHQNRVNYRYNCIAAEDECYLSSIEYGEGVGKSCGPPQDMPGVVVGFVYEPRADALTYATGKGLSTIGQRLRRIQVRSGTAQTLAYTLSYVGSPQGGSSLASSVSVEGSTDPALAPADAPTQTFGMASATAWTPWAKATSLDLGTSEWPSHDPDWHTFDTPTAILNYREVNEGHDNPWFPADLDGDGRTDALGVFAALDDTVELRAAIALPGGGFAVTAQATSWDYRFGWDTPRWIRFHVGDVDGDRRTDITLVRNSGQDGFFVTTQTALSNGDGFFTVLPDQTPSVLGWDFRNPDGRARSRWLGGDVDADGRNDMVVIQPSATCTAEVAAWCGCDPAANPSQSCDHAMFTAGISRGDGTYDWTTTHVPWTFRPQDDPHWHVGDHDGDGKADIMRVEEAGPDGTFAYLHAHLAVALSTGTGAFTPVSTPVSPSGGTQDTTVSYFSPVLRLPSGRHDYLGSDRTLAGDFNGDGRTDLVMMNSYYPGYAGASPRILITTALSEGELGRFELREYYSAISTRQLNSTHAARPERDFNRWLVSDVDGDGASDLVVTSHGDWAGDARLVGTTWITRLVSDHRGGFVPQVSYEREDWELNCVELDGWRTNCEGNTFHDLLPGDVNADGRDDLIYVGVNFDNDTAWLSVDPAQMPNVVNRSDAWRSTDVDGDGRLDFVAIQANNPGFMVSTRLQRDYGAFPTAQLEVQGTHYLFESDLPGNAPQSSWHVMDIGGPDGRPDGKGDLVLVEPRANGDQAIHVYLGNGDATWTRVEKPIVHGAGNANAVAMTLPAGERGVWRRLDVDGNGAMDLVNVSRAAQGLRVVAVLAHGDGTFAVKSREQFTGTTPPTAVGQPGPLSAEARTMLDPWEVVDLDGDGRDDLIHLEARPTGTIARSLLATDLVDDAAAHNHGWREREFSIGVTPRDVRNYQPAELNGDGATDLVYVEALANPQRVAIRGLLSKGDGSFAAAPAWTPHTLVTPGALDRRAPIVTDLDRDGRSDLVLATDANGVTRFLTMWNQVWRWQPSQQTIAATTAGRSGRWMPFSLANDGTELVSISRGTIDIVRAVIPRDELVRHDNGAGTTRFIRYRSSEGLHASMPIGASMRVVEQLEGSDVAHPFGWVQTVRYEDLRYSHALHRTLGFHVVRYADARGTTIEVYEQTDFCGSRLGGTERHDGAGKAISMTHVQYAPQGTGAAICLPRHVTRRECEGEPLGKCRITGETYDHDAYGNVIRLTEHGDAANPDDSRRTDHPTVPNTTAYIVNRPAYTNVSELVGLQWSVVASTLYVYDANADHTTMPTQGDLRESRAWDDVDQVYRTTRTTYTPSGLPKATFGPPTPANPTGLRSEVTYDCEYERFPVSQCNALGCATATWDRSLGVITSMTDLAGATVSTAYDRLGREVRAENALGGVVTTTFPAAAQLGTNAQEVWTAMNDGTADGQWSVRRFDGLGRVTRATDESGDVETFDYLDGTSAATVTTMTFASGTAPAVRRVTYDAASRGWTQVVAEGTANQGNARIDRFVGGWTEVDAMGNERTYFTDGYDRIVAVRDLFRPCEGWDVTCTGGTYSFTRYVYDARDDLTDVIDDAGNVTHFERDSLGGVREQCDPDAGCTQLEYYPDGSIKAEVDADQRRVENDYDAVGRPLRRVYSQAGGRPDRSVEFVYDIDPTTGAPAPNGTGRLSRVIDKRDGGSEIIDTFTYDPLGHVTLEERCVDGDCIETAFTYDPNGRLAEVVYPDPHSGTITSASERVDYGYDDAGRVSRVGEYVRKIEYADGKASFVQYGNSVETVFTRDPDRGWVERIDVTSRNGVLLALEYGFDKGGRVRSHASTNLAPLSWTFGYDSLDRLTRVTSSNSTYDQTLEYDPTGQIRLNSAVGTYDYADPLHVHAVTSTTAGDVYAYDRSGRLTLSNDVEATWGTDGMPERIENRRTGAVVDFLYDHRGERTRRSGSGGDTTTFSGFVERMPNGHLATNYLLDGRRVARRELGNATYYTYDLLDGVRLVTDDFGAEVARYDYAPYGSTIASSGPIPNDLTLADGRSDEDLPLVDMNARFYDPRLGRFISADSLIPNVFDSQALDRFAYVLDSPTNFTDPTGHAPVEPADDSHFDPDAKRELDFDPEEITGGEARRRPLKVPGPAPAGITIGERDGVSLIDGTSFDDVWNSLEDTRNGMFWTGRLVAMLDAGKTSLTMPEFKLTDDDLLDAIGDDLGGCEAGCMTQGDGMPQSMAEAAAIRAEVEHYRQFGPRTIHDLVEESWGEHMGGWELLASMGGRGKGKVMARNGYYKGKAIPRTKSGGLTFRKTPYMYKPKPGEKAIVKIKYTGSRKGDYKAANAKAKLGRFGDAPPPGYRWHHVDFNKTTGMGTMELVEKGPHGIWHQGGVREFEEATGIKYK